MANTVHNFSECVIWQKGGLGCADLEVAIQKLALDHVMLFSDRWGFVKKELLNKASNLYNA